MPDNLKSTLSSKGGIKTGLKVDGLDALIEVMHLLPDRLEKRVIGKAVNAGGNPILKAGRQMAPRGQNLRHEVKGGLSVRIQRNKHLANTFIKKVKSYKGGLIGMAMMGSQSSTAPHGHLVHQGTGKDVIGTPPPGSSKPRKGNRDYVVPAGKVLRIPVGDLKKLHGGTKAPNGRVQPGDYIFIRGGMKNQTIIRNKGSKPNPWWDFAATREQNNAMRAMKDKLGVEIVRELRK